MAEPEAAVVTLLDAIASPIALIDKENLFAGPVTPDDVGHPATSVFVTLYNSERDAKLERNSVQVLIRAARENYAQGIALAQACKGVLHCVIPTGYVDVQAQSGPYYLRTDMDGRHLWAISVTLVRAL